jgi:hypothetical protein
MEKKSLSTLEIAEFMLALGVAFGGRSQVTWQAIGMALRGRVENGGWHNVCIDDTLTKVIDSEFEFWGWEDHLRDQTKFTVIEIMRGYNR